MRNEEPTIELELVPCDFCKSTDFKVQYSKPDLYTWFSSYEFNVVKCDNCQLVYVNPRPTMKSMTSYYPPKYFSKRDTDIANKRYMQQLKYLPSLNNEKILDIGCAKGDFLAFLGKRFPNLNLHGCDAFNDKVAHPNIEFCNAELSNAGYPASCFDLVTAWAVFEHLHFPSKYFEELGRILKPKGKFIFLVPNANSLYGKKSYREDLPRHLHHFSRNTVEKYANRYGLSLTNIHYTNDVFNGKGKGLFYYSLARLANISWKQIRNKDLSLFEKIILKIGRALDYVTFLTDWEAKLKRSGVMIIELQKQ
ncbi:class I SAM-dependent methyltransferase [Alkalimarinus alittae]|uniref:Class I SAM-dependent methyltransferase n=1 Tax=Alkalimarinus alittae TaxID=2961619 RepID=A0ABY6MZA9_9ALTE|nr:class I SAM-dependent methyltransferase [Alkalimarinus alittae]UZE95154.1 class I SAM-dependent methyltransferase [Alkalimarinus alittae]